MPKSKQFQTWLTTNDTKTLNDGIFARWPDTVMLRVRSNTKTPALSSTFHIQNMGGENTRIFLLPSACISRVQCRFIEEQDHWIVDELFNPVVEFDRCYQDGAIMRRGRFYVITGYYDENDRWVDKPREFLDWADRLFRLVKRTLIYERSRKEYFGQEAHDLYKRAAMEFRSM